MCPIIACDEELILQYRKNSKEAYDFLLQRNLREYTPLLRKYYNLCQPFGGTMEDLTSLFYESFHKAVLRFVFGDVLFKTYFLKLLNRDLAGYYRYISQPCKVANAFLSLDQEISYDSNLTFHDIINTEEQKNDLRNQINIQLVFELLNELPIDKKDEETKRIIVLKAVGYNVNEIAKLTNLKPPAVRRRIKSFYTSELGEKIRSQLL